MNDSIGQPCAYVCLLHIPSDFVGEVSNQERNEQILAAHGQAAVEKYWVWHALEHALVCKGIDVKNAGLVKRGNRWECEHAFVSLAHGGGYAVAVVADTPVGIDIEPMVIRESRLRAIRSVLTERERAIAQDEPTTLYRIWTAKEALFKKEASDVFNPRSIETSAAKVKHRVIGESMICLAGGESTVWLHSDDGSTWTEMFEKAVDFFIKPCNFT